MAIEFNKMKLTAKGIKVYCHCDLPLQGSRAHEAKKITASLCQGKNGGGHKVNVSERSISNYDLCRVDADDHGIIVRSEGHIESLVVLY